MEWRFGNLISDLRYSLWWSRHLANSNGPDKVFKVESFTVFYCVTHYTKNNLLSAVILLQDEGLFVLCYFRSEEKAQARVRKDWQILIDLPLECITICKYISHLSSIYIPSICFGAYHIIWDFSNPDTERSSHIQIRENVVLYIIEN